MTAIFAGTDECAHGVYQAVRDGGRRVAGFNDTYANALNPRLATIREFPEQLGKQMAELLLNRIDHPYIPPQRVTIPTELVRGESCRPVAELTARSDAGRED